MFMMLSSSIERRKGSGAASGGTSTNANAILYCYRIYRYIIVVIVLAFAMGMHLALMYYNDEIKVDIDQSEAIDQIMMAAAEKKATYKYEDTVSKTIVVEKKKNLSIQQATLDHLKTLKDFPKIIHLMWPDKDILSKDYEILEHGAKNLQRLNPDWQFLVSSSLLLFIHHAHILHTCIHILFIHRYMIMPTLII